MFIKFVKASSNIQNNLIRVTDIYPYRPNLTVSAPTLFPMKFTDVMKNSSNITFSSARSKSMKLLVKSTKDRIEPYALKSTNKKKKLQSQIPLVNTETLTKVKEIDNCLNRHQQLPKKLNLRKNINKHFVFKTSPASSKKILILLKNNPQKTSKSIPELTDLQPIYKIPRDDPNSPSIEIINQHEIKPPQHKLSIQHVLPKKINLRKNINKNFEFNQSKPTSLNVKLSGAFVLPESSYICEKHEKVACNLRLKMKTIQTENKSSKTAKKPISPRKTSEKRSPRKNSEKYEISKYECVWFLGEIVDYDSKTKKYKVQDVDDNGLVLKRKNQNNKNQNNKKRNNKTQNSNNCFWVLSKYQVSPLPRYKPDLGVNPKFEFQNDDNVMALYPNTTCFYKAVVYDIPKSSTDPYLITFEDFSFESGITPPIPVPQQFVLHSSKLNK